MHVDSFFNEEKENRMESKYGNWTECSIDLKKLMVRY
jgi:hypothetical protein